MMLCGSKAYRKRDVSNKSADDSWKIVQFPVGFTGKDVGEASTEESLRVLGTADLVLEQEERSFI